MVTHGKFLHHKILLQGSTSSLVCGSSSRTTFLDHLDRGKTIGLVGSLWRRMQHGSRIVCIQRRSDSLTNLCSCASNMKMLLPFEIVVCSLRQTSSAFLERSQSPQVLLPCHGAGDFRDPRRNTQFDPSSNLGLRVDVAGLFRPSSELIH